MATVFRVCCGTKAGEKLTGVVAPAEMPPAEVPLVDQTVDSLPIAELPIEPGGEEPIEEQIEAASEEPVEFSTEDPIEVAAEVEELINADIEVPARPNFQKTSAGIPSQMNLIPKPPRAQTPSCIWPAQASEAAGGQPRAKHCCVPAEWKQHTI